MAQPAKPLRADAARNRARVLEVAYDTFAAEGLSVPIDEIARLLLAPLPDAHCRRAVLALEIGEC